MKFVPLKEPYFFAQFPLLKKIWHEFALFPVALELKALKRPPILFFREIARRQQEKEQGAVSPFQAGQLNLFALQQKIFRRLVVQYLSVQCPGILREILDTAGYSIDSVDFAEVAEAFCDHFPGQDLLEGTISTHDWLFDEKEALKRRESVLIEMFLLRLTRENRAVDPFRTLCADDALAKIPRYEQLLDHFEEGLSSAPAVAGGGLPLPKLLRLPFRIIPDSLYEQLKWIQSAWGDIVAVDVLEELGTAFAAADEEWRVFAPRGEPGSIDVLEFGAGDAATSNDYYPEFEAYSSDTDWMPNVVLIAKMVYVWLGQLSIEYGEEITRLDQIPDRELDRLARCGFTGLWLIGIWERSDASRKIKQFTGNPEAIASAYSLYDYTIARDLGGEEALWNLKSRALKRGIRMASDMVPNHTGLYSRWILEHPDWFVQLDYPPYPAYSFSGPDLSDSPDISLHIEDGYWDRSDAAVVFKYYDHRDGRTRYIYHGNDGTSTPWNDTAQLNYLLPEVREAVSGTILHVASMFPIIRFDAAMTLAKKHYQRLWFPQPGHGGVASRAEQGMTREAFDQSMPEEFWRQVVDRISSENPDTLLLAEAFWLMEGYFVRTLGMHRVYNSAFMNMLKMEENAKYRQTIKNVLEFDPQVLQRFVNFMNNPDEKTAVEQFGKEQKYFGACVLLATMPGLPMFGHGQIEGFHEKYGMEYKRAYWNEPIDEHLVRQHERFVFPLLKRRWLFSGSENFVFYDFWCGSSVNEDVFAYSNRVGDQRALIIFQNRFATSSGWIRTSTSRAVKREGDNVQLSRTTLSEALGFKGDGRHYYRYRDYASRLEYIHNGRELCDQGLQITLEAYQCSILLDFQEIWDDEYGTWGKLCHSLQGRGVDSIQEEVKQVRFAALNDQFREVLNRYGMLFSAPEETASPESREMLKRSFSADLASFCDLLADTASLPVPDRDSLSDTASRLTRLEEVLTESGKSVGPTAGLLLVSFFVLRTCEELFAQKPDADTHELLIESLGLIRPFEEALYGESTSEEDLLALLDVPSASSLLRALLRFPSLAAADFPAWHALVPDLLNDRHVRSFLGSHPSGGHLWIIRERWELLVEWLVEADLCALSPAITVEGAVAREKKNEIILELKEYAADCNYRIDLLLDVSREKTVGRQLIVQ